MNTEVFVVLAIVFCFILFFFIIPFFVRAILASRCKHKWNTFTTIHYCNDEKCWDEAGQCCEVCGKVRYIKVKKD